MLLLRNSLNNNQDHKGILHPKHDQAILLVLSLLKLKQDLLLNHKRRLDQATTPSSVLLPSKDRAIVLSRNLNLLSSDLNLLNSVQAMHLLSLHNMEVDQATPRDHLSKDLKVNQVDTLVKRQITLKAPAIRVNTELDQVVHTTDQDYDEKFI